MNTVARLYQDDRKAWWLILAFTALRLAVAPTCGLGTDEAHYVLYARYLDLSYFDHPPLVGWTHALFYYTLGTNEFLARLPAILIFVVTSFLIYRFARSYGDERSALLATAAVNGSFLISGLGLMLLPESLLVPIVFAIIFTVRRLERKPDLIGFVLLGFFLGLAGLAKYTAILFVPALMMYGIIRRRFDIILNPRMLIAAAVALAVISPVIIWNMRNDFMSFRYQSGHVVGGSSPSLKRLFSSLGAQFGAYSPPLFCLAWYGACQSFKNRRHDALLPALIGLTLLVFFLYSSLFKFSLPHWSAVFYALYIPLGVVFLDQSQVAKKRGVLIFSLGFSIVIALLLQAEIAVKAFRFPDYKSPFRTVYRVPDVVKRANEILAKDPSSNKALAVTNWTEVSRTIYYNAPYGSRVFLISDSSERFSRWISGSPLGADLLFLNSHDFRRDVLRDMKCREVQNADTLDITLNGGKVNTVDFVWCRDFQGSRN
jgi:4-amino-4-deoxy-L-arabinose transferase-like glycosyltransferase